MFDFPILPRQASTIAGQVDAYFWTLIWLSVILGGAVAMIFLFFFIRYRRGNKVNRKLVANERRERMIEITWTVLPVFLAIGMFGWSTSIYFNMIRPPADAMEIQVVGKQWMWQIQHSNGRREINELHVPVNQPVKLRMISQDVIHSFFVPAFRVKQDVLPGRYTTLWFNPTEVGEYHLFCAEYCGTDHSQMTGTVYVMEPADYEAWLTSEGGATVTGLEGESLSPEEAGAALFEQLGCSGCHKADVRSVGPALGSIFGTTTELESGEVVAVDEEYLRQSILLPNEQVVKGFAPIMPTFEGQVSEAQIINLIAYIKSLKNPNAGEAAPLEPKAAATEAAAPAETPVGGKEATPSADVGAELFAKAGCSACHSVTGDMLVGPPLNGIFGHEVELESGETVTADEAYLEESIFDPNAKVVKGFVPAMPPFAGMLSEAEVANIIEYLKSIGDK